ncbi:serine/threonine-protein kinase [Actinoplanes teichomyceticus]|uniref:serine/threonine-protein kinase n=1 Tax=Actinoplanes teichomyceticus TaxID=1867 RepID=UPI001EF358DB|nr:serine/threonine-protein kinase [Actinoplanes teichomyceticus]
MQAVIAGRYRIIRPLGSGGMSHVWLAHDEVRHIDVAIKQCTVPPGLRPDQQAVVRTWAVSEAQAAARVRHPHVIRTLDVLPDPNGPWLIMEYVPGRSLQQLIQERGPLPPARVARIGLAVLDALTAVGRAGLLHLDVKPGNVLIADDGRVVLIDFGPAVTEAGVAALTGARVVLGSPKYIAPERLFDRVSTASSDMWSLGATLYHAVEGRPPYARSSTAATLRALADGPPDPSRRAGPLTPVLAGLLRYDPGARLDPAGTAELLRRAVEPPPRSRIRRRVPALAAALTLVATLVIGGSAQGDERPPSAGTPAGYTTWSDPAGFQLAVPAGWSPGRIAGTVTFTDPPGRVTLRIRRWPHPPADMVAALVAEERSTRLPGYRRLRITSLPEPPDALWEYTFTDPEDGPMRGLRRVVSGTRGTYVVEWRAPRPDWGAQLPKLAVVLQTFA